MKSLSPAFTSSSPSRGFGLIELMITMVLVVVVLGAVMLAFFRGSAQAQRLVNVADRRQSARTAVQLVEREVRMAGSGWGRIPVYGNDGTGNPIIIQAVNPGCSTSAMDDSVTLVGAWGASTSIKDAMPSSSSTLKVEDVTGFASGDLCIISNGSSANMLQVTATNASSGNLQHNPASPYNDPGGHAADWHWPSGGYGVGSLVFKITMSTYYMDRTSFRKPVLMRRPFGGSPQVAAYNVDGFRVFYGLQNGTWTRKPKDMMSVEKVSPVVLTALRDPRRPALIDSVWAVAQPRVF